MSNEAGTQAKPVVGEPVTRRKSSPPSKTQSKTPYDPQSKTLSQPAAEPSHNQPQTPSDEAIRESAYLRWEAAGRPAGKDLCFWLEAENELAGPRHETC